MYWFILLFPLLIYPWGYDPYYTLPKTVYLQLFVLFTWLHIIIKRKYVTLALDRDHYKVEKMVAIFFGLAVLSTVFSVNQSLSLYGAEKRYEGLLTIFSYCSILLFSYRFIDEEQIKRLMPGMIIVSIFVSVYGILQHFGWDFLPRNSRKLNYERSYAFFDNPNFFGSYLVLMLLIGVVFFLLESKKKMMLFYFIAIQVNFIALLYSETRSGWVGVFCSFLFLTIFLVLKTKRVWKKWSVLISTMALILLIMNVSEKGDISKRVNTVISDSYKIVANESTGREGSSRLFIWRESLPLIKDYFWLGSGPDTFAEVFPAANKEKEQFLGNSRIIVDKAHNEYLQIAVTLGIPALLIYLTIVYYVMSRAFKATSRKSERDKIYFYGLLSVLLGYLVQAFFNISVVTVAPLFWAILGITLAQATKVLHTEQNESRTISSN